jgi:hypothetical protein
LYWTGVQTVINRHGWIYKSVQDMQEETGLTKVEQKNARQDLMAKGVLECVLRGVPRFGITGSIWTVWPSYSLGKILFNE